MPTPPPPAVTKPDTQAADIALQAKREAERIQKEQDEAIRAPSRGATIIGGGPGTGKTVVALHRAAYLLYTDRRRFESGGVLVVGPSTVFMKYIERVLPSLGETSVTLSATSRRHSVAPFACHALWACGGPRAIRHGWIVAPLSAQ